MLLETLIGASAAMAGVLAYARMKRLRLYDGLAVRIAGIARDVAPGIRLDSERPLPDFGQRLAAVPDFLPQDTFEALKEDILRCALPERNYVPTHKQGGTVAYETLITAAPRVAAFYHSPALQAAVSRLTGVAVRPTPLHDQSSLSILCYEKPGDHIGWHLDHNFYRGRHFTILLPIVNQGTDANGLSHCRLKAWLNGKETDIETAPNTLIVFEGAKVLHKATPLHEGERRILLSMTYCADPRAYWWQGIARRIKDIAFFGVRALWT